MEDRIDDIARIPPFKNEEISTSLSQSVDWGAKLLNIPETWKVTKGGGITVLVLDTGCPAENGPNGPKVHPDLKHNILVERCRSFVPNEDIFDRQGHSTACAGIIAAEDNMMGLVGYAPEAKVITYKVLSSNGSGRLAWIEQGLEAAVELAPDIVSMSLGCRNGTRKMQKLIKELDSMGIPVICAAGNGGESVGVEYPAKYEESFAIGAFDEHRKIADFSAKGDEIDFVFPGVDISTTWLGGQYSVLSGTSFACPSCAGLVALLLAKHRRQEAETGMNDCKTTMQIYEHLKKYAVNPEHAAERDKDWGWGYVDVNRLFELENAKRGGGRVSVWSRILKFFGL